MRGDDDLVRLLARPDAEVERAALLIAADANPTLDTERCLAVLGDLAAPLLAPVREAAGDATAQAALLAGRLFDELGFHGNADDYYDPRNSYLDQVLARRTGIPITLAVVLIAVGRRAGALVEGVGFPGHFLTRVGGAEGVLVDPFDGGRILGAQDVDALARRFVGDPARLRPEHLAVVDTAAIVVRMLMNLKHAHERRGDHAQALVVCDRLVDLTGRPEARRDRGRHALALGSHAAAADDLAAYLEARPDARDVPALRVALDEARRRARSESPS